MTDIVICEFSDIPDGGCKVFKIDDREIGIYRLAGEIHAYLNTCPHASGPVCQGAIVPRTLESINADSTCEGRVFSANQFNLVCPWHGFEFDIRTGEHPTEKRFKLRKIDVQRSDAQLVLKIDQKN